MFSLQRVQNYQSTNIANHKVSSPRNKNPFFHDKIPEPTFHLNSTMEKARGRTPQKVRLDPINSKMRNVSFDGSLLKPEKAPFIRYNQATKPTGGRIGADFFNQIS